MDKYAQRKLTLEPLYTFLTEDTTPKEFAKLLDELLLEHLRMLIRLQKLDTDDKTIHEHTDEFILYITILRDILPNCENNRTGI